MSDKVYVGNGKAIDTQYGELLKISFSKSDLEMMQSMLNEKGWINLNVNKRKEPSQYGDTHSIVVDTWKPDGQQSPAPQQSSAPQQSYSMPDDNDIPF